MAEETAVVLMHRFRTSADADTMISLLRSQQAAVTLALMAARLGGGDIIESQTLIAAIGADLHAIGRSYIDLDDNAGDEAPLRLGAEATLKKWTEKGWVHRTTDPVTEREYYQLTSGAVQAVQYMRGLDRHTTVATESAVEMLAEQLTQIAAQADPDPYTRREAINDQIDVLVRQRDAIDQGEAPVVDHADLVHRLEALCQWIERMPADIVRYGEQLQEATAQLWRRDWSEAVDYGESLEWMLEEYQQITQTPAGQAYQAFNLLVGRSDLRARLEGHIDEILDRVDRIPDHARSALAGFVQVMRRRSQEVEAKKRTAYRRISLFVHSGEASRFRSVRAHLAEIQKAAREAFEQVHAGKEIGFALRSGGLVTESLGRWQLADGVSKSPPPVADTTDEFPVDPREAVGLEHIDQEALRAAVAAALEAHQGFVTLPQVLEQVAGARSGDVVMLWSWAGEHGHADASGRRVTVPIWTRRGERAMTLPFLVFDKPIPAPGGARAPETIETQATLWEGTTRA